MAKIPKKRCKVTKKPVRLDFSGALSILEKRGVKKDLKVVAAEIGFSTVSIHQWKFHAPEIVAMIYHFLKDNHITFEEFVKLCDAPAKK